MVDHNPQAESGHSRGATAEGRAAADGRLTLIIVTPEATVLDERVDFVALPLYDGEIGIAPGRAPLIGRLGYGELRLVSGGQTRRFYVDGGFVQVVANVVSVLTNRSLPAAQVDGQVAAENLAQARARKANSEELLAIRDRLEQQARAQIRVASRAR
jgi:F-type H+-transporting ATPase subunit epsilon